VQKLETNKLNFISDVQPYLLNHYFDPGNQYSVPYYIGVFGLGINKAYFKNKFIDDTVHADWGLIFDKQKITYPICMTDDPRQALMLAAYYLYGSIDACKEPAHLVQIKNLLVEQKKFVELYTDARVEEVLASGSCPVALGISSDVWKIMRSYDNIDFIVPQGKMIVGMESFVIPAKTKKTDLVYQLLNFLYRPDIIRTNSLLYGFCPPIKGVDVKSEKIFCISESDAPRIEFFRNVISEKVLQNLWIFIMSH